MPGMDGFELVQSVRSVNKTIPILLMTARDDLAAKLTTVLTADAAERLRLQVASLEGVKVHDIDRTLRTFEALYQGLPVEG